jgi:hypothetical protein
MLRAASAPGNPPMSVSSRAARASALLLLCAALPQAALAAPQPLHADEVALSTGSWSCSRYRDAAASGGEALASDVVEAVRQFAAGYVSGVADAVGRALPESVANRQRIVVLLDQGCADDGTRAVRDSTLLAGRAMLADERTAHGEAAPDATGALACSVYLDARRAGGLRFERLGRNIVQNWADGYINARFERAGRGLIPTAKNKALMLERFGAACAAAPQRSIREAARMVVDAALPGK